MVRNTGLCLFFVGLLLRSCTGVYKDVVWVVDVSSAVSAVDHELIIDFIYNVTTYLTIGQSDVRMAVTVFDEEVNDKFELDHFDVKSNLLSAIDGIAAESNPKPIRKTMDGLTRTKTMFLTLKGGRSDAAKAVITIVSGVSTDTSTTISVANELRTSYGAEIFSIGIGQSLSSTNTELKGIANDPDTYYMEYIGNYSYLCGLIPSLVPKIDNQTTASLSDDCEIWTDPEQEQEETYRKINAGLSGGAIAGIILASLLILAMVSLMLYFLLRRKKKKVQHEENQKDKNIINAINDYGDASLGEKNHIFKRDYSTISVTPIKALIDNDSPLSSVYETLGERSAANSVVNVRVPE